MRFFTFYIGLSIFIFGCTKDSKTTLKYLDEYILEDNIYLKKDKIGGLSGIDFSKNSYYFVVDDSEKPRFLKGNINISGDSIQSIIFNETVYLNDSTTTFYKENVFDLESIFIDNQGDINLISEGNIKKGKKPLVFKTTKKGTLITNFELPKSFENTKNIRHNGVFEGSSKSINTNGFWVVMETPLKQDGVEATFQKTNSPCRITYFDNQTKKATKQFAYQLEKIDKPAKGTHNINGITAILEFKKNHFFVIERAYQSGYGAYGNVVRIFEASIDEQSTNLLGVESLKITKTKPLKKRLLFDFSTVRNQLTEGIIDNIEGITFGTKLSNGNSSLILVADDNFQKFGKQLNQFILMEIRNK